MRTVEEIKRDIEAVNAEERPFACSPSSHKVWQEWKLNGLKSELFDTVTASIPLERLTELCQSELDGRVEVFPCNVGDTVHFACVVISDFGKTVVLTRESTEAALEVKDV